MKNNMGRQLKVLILAILCIVLVVPAMNMNANAATQRQKAIAAYKKYMAQSKVYIMPKGSSYYGEISERHIYNGTSSLKAQFCIANIDNDSVPELVITGKIEGDNVSAYTILTYKNGKIRRVHYEYSKRFTGYYPKTGIYVDRGDQPYACIRYCKLKGLNKPKVMMYNYSYEHMGDKRSEGYCIGDPSMRGKSCSAKTFAAYRKKITGGKSLIRVKFHNNTASNRKLKLR